MRKYLRKINRGLFVVLCCSSMLLPSVARAISTTQLDTFSDGTRQGWSMGMVSINDTHMTNLVTGGPNGAGDHYLEVTADGVRAAGGRLTFFNSLQWSGDYLSNGITAISMDLKNISSANPLNIRLGLNGGIVDPNNLGNVLGGLFATSASVSLAPGSGWTHVEFSINPADLVPVSGRSGLTGNDVLQTLGNVKELRILNSPVPGWSGQPVVATLGIDNIAAVVVPLPPTALLFTSGLFGIWLTGRQTNRVSH